MTSPRPADHPNVKSGKIGVLLLNLGTPDATDYWSMRRYLKEFLSDRRVIEVSRWLWWPLLNLIILTTRPGRKGKDYAKVWNREKDESFLKTITRAQAEKLQASIANPYVIVDWAMRYGNPSLASRLKGLQDQGCDRILAVPLYPQYAAATTATANDHLFRALMAMRWQPTIRIAPPYHDDETYIASLAKSLREGLSKLDFAPEKILVSFHGMPKSYLLKGDPYFCHCAKTFRLLCEALPDLRERLVFCFQSRFGGGEWLKPYTDETVKSLAASGVKSMAIIAPGFSSDCLETLEELDGENRHYFEANGGQNFAYIPCLNDSDDGMAVIRAVVQRELGGWSTL
jgi:ferrochelatase